MNEFCIFINIKKLSNYSALYNNKLDKKTLLLIIESFSQYISNLYMMMIEEAIYSRRYEGKWEPLDEKGYLDYLGVTPENSIVTLMRDAMEYKKIGYNFIVRFNPYYKYPGTKLYLNKVLRAIENGTSDFNSRPIFKKIKRDINQNILDLWRGYLSMRGVI